MNGTDTDFSAEVAKLNESIIDPKLSLRAKIDKGGWTNFFANWGPQQLGILKLFAVEPYVLTVFGIVVVLALLVSDVVVPAIQGDIIDFIGYVHTIAAIWIGIGVYVIVSTGSGAYRVNTQKV